MSIINELRKTMGKDTNDIITVNEDNHYYHLVKIPLSSHTTNTMANHLTETNVERMLSKHKDAGYIVLSAYRNSNTEQENNIDTKQLKKDINNSGYSFIPVWGAYAEDPEEEGAERPQVQTEKSFIITNFPKGSKVPNETTDELFSLGKNLAGKYNQDSFLYVPSEGSKLYNGEDLAYWIDRNGKIVDEPFKSVSPTKDADEFFSRISKSHRDVIDYKNKEGDIEPSKRDKSFTYEGVLYLANTFNSMNEAQSWRKGEKFINFNITEYIREWERQNGLR